MPSVYTKIQMSHLSCFQVTRKNLSQYLNLILSITFDAKSQSNLHLMYSANSLSVTRRNITELKQKKIYIRRRSVEAAIAARRLFLLSFVNK